MSTTIFHNNDSMMSRNGRNEHYGVAIGFLIGVLIQLSSLCSNSSDFGIPWPLRRSENDVGDFDDLYHNEKLSFQQLRVWKLAWSTGTTILGIVLLMTLRALVMAVQKSFMTHSINVESSSTVLCESIRRMEQSVATGTLWGVSVAWVITDYLLGFAIPDMNMPYWYIPVLATSMALLVWHLVLQYVTTAHYDIVDECDPVENQMNDDASHALLPQQLRTPLLSKDEIDLEIDDNDTITIPASCITIDTQARRGRIVPLLSFGTGMIIGIFIQCSTLGVSCLEQFVSFSRSTVSSSSIGKFTATQIDTSNAIVDDTTDIDSSSVIAIVQWSNGMAIAASFVMSCIGLLLLLCIRTFMMGVITWTPQQQQQQHSPSPNTKENLTTTTSSASSASSSFLVAPSRSSGGPDNIATFILTHVEVYMAMGTALGLNLAWMVTDMMVRRSLPSIDQPHDYWYQSIITLVVSTLWCPVVLVCTGYFYSSGAGRTPCDDSNRQDDSTTSSSFTVIDNDDNHKNDPHDHTNEPNERPCHSITSRVPVHVNGDDMTDEEMAYM